MHLRCIKYWRAAWDGTPQRRELNRWWDAEWHRQRLTGSTQPPAATDDSPVNLSIFVEVLQPLQDLLQDGGNAGLVQHPGLVLATGDDVLDDVQDGACKTEARQQPRTPDREILARQVVNRPLGKKSVNWKQKSSLAVSSPSTPQNTDQERRGFSLLLWCKQGCMYKYKLLRATFCLWRRKSADPSSTSKDVSKHVAQSEKENVFQKL